MDLDELKAKLENKSEVVYPTGDYDKRERMAEPTDENSGLNIPVVMPRILHFVDENGNNVDLNAAGVNAKLLRDGTFEYFISYGFAGRKELTPVYGA